MSAIQHKTACPSDDEQRFKQLTRRPTIAWPTLALLGLAVVLFAATTAAALHGALSYGYAVLFNTVAAYLAFTVAHDASHNALSLHRSLNDWCGRLATALLSPVPFFRMFRYIHMQHHRFANEPGKDPDLYCGTGPRWTLPLRWATLDLHYFLLYLRPDTFRSRPRKERVEFVIAVIWAVTFAIVLIAAGFATEYLLLFIVPSRLAVLVLAFAFDFLPHHPHQHSGREHPYQATANRTGAEWLLTPLLLSQNYHLVHHLYPTLPFYRYLSVWRARERTHRAQQPAEIPAFGLQPIGSVPHPEPLQTQR